MKIYNKKGEILWESIDDDFCGANLCEANLYLADLRGLNLRKANLCRADLCGSDLREADLSEAILVGADLHIADLRGTNLYKADLRKANFREANLYRAFLFRADLREADFYMADLREASFRGANLCSANLHSADLQGANLRGADLTDAKGLVKMMGVTQGNFYWKRFYEGLRSSNYRFFKVGLNTLREGEVFEDDERILYSHPGFHFASRSWCAREYPERPLEALIRIPEDAKINEPWATCGSASADKIEIIRVFDANTGEDVTEKYM